MRVEEIQMLGPTSFCRPRTSLCRSGPTRTAARYHRRIFAVKGQGGPHPVWPKKPTAKNIRGERPWMVGTDWAKATIMGRLRNAQPGTLGYSHFPADREQPFFEQLLGAYSKGPACLRMAAQERRPSRGAGARVYAYAALRALVGWAGLGRRGRPDRRAVRPAWQRAANRSSSQPQPLDGRLSRVMKRLSR